MKKAEKFTKNGKRASEKAKQTKSTNDQSKEKEEEEANDGKATEEYALNEPVEQEHDQECEDEM